MKFQTIIAAAAIPIAVVAASGTAQAQSAIDWEAENAIAFGNGCSSRAGDTVFIAAGDSVAVLFSRFGVDLPAGGTNPALAGLRSCSVRIPARIRRGFYIAELIQTITYGVNKSTNSSGDITSLASFLGRSVASFNVHIPYGTLSSPAVTATKTTPFLILAACRGHDIRSLYRSEMAVNGVRGSRDETIIVATEGLDLRYEVTFPILVCPEP